jgi:acyl dehydratase
VIAVGSAAELESRVGELLGTSDWHELSYQEIAGFGAITGDTHWIHVDRERARSEGPFGDVIAHGFLLLSLMTGLGNECYAIERATRWTNYGLDRVRFTAPVTPSDAVRLALTLQAMEVTDTGVKLTLGCELQVRGKPRPALVANWLVLVAEEDGA